jgi:hypothetical protein
MVQNKKPVIKGKKSDPAARSGQLSDRHGLFFVFHGFFDAAPKNGRPHRAAGNNPACCFFSIPASLTRE